AGGIYTVGTGQTYPSLTEAAADLNHRGVSGPVTLRLTDAVYDSVANQFPILIGPIAGTSPTNTVTIEPASGTATILWRGSVNGIIGTVGFTGNPGDIPIVGIIAARYVTMRGLTITCGPGTTRQGLLVTQVNGAEGAQFNTFRDLTIRLISGGGGTAL